ncbi:MAG: hypothetical protein RMZ41_025830, partial [Nostoc sp. DedVER02]|uniref:hypothetical protein n=1 Tax=Nostoc sp. DedVER02 TaxID=3075405 RepID=UPI0039193B0E
RCCGNDSLGVALRKNSSMPGIILQLETPKLTSLLWGFCLSESWIDHLANLSIAKIRYLFSEAVARTN